MLSRRYSISITIGVASILILGLYPNAQTGNIFLPVSKQSLNVNKQNDNNPFKFVIDSAYAIPADSIPQLIQEGRHVVEVNLVAQSVDLPIMGGVYHAMTFNGQVPGPIIRATQGDIIKVTLTVPSSEPTPHGIDMHASQTTASDFGAVKPGSSTTYAYIAEVPGTFKYHCSGVNVAAMDQHVLSGMYGLTIVDPLNGYKSLIVDKTYVQNGQVLIKHQTYDADAKEFALEYNQLYLSSDGSYDQTAMFLHNTTQTVVNGFAFGYVPNADLNKLIKGDASKNIFVAQPWNSPNLKQFQSHPLFVDTGVHYRIFVENQGNMPVFFHIVGEIIDRVTQGNRVQAQGTETWQVGGSQGAIMDLVFDNPGVYVAVNHDYAAIFSGAATVFVAGDPFKLGYGPGDMANPSDAVPPIGKNSIQQKTIPHCLSIDIYCGPPPLKPKTIELNSFTYTPDSDAFVTVTFDGTPQSPSQVSISSDHGSDVKTITVAASGANSLTGRIHLSASCNPGDPICFRVNLHDTISAVFHDHPPDVNDLVTTAMIINNNGSQIWFEKDSYTMGSGAAIFVFDNTANTDPNTQGVINAQVANNAGLDNSQNVELREISDPVTNKYDTNTYTNDWAVMFTSVSDPTMPSLAVANGGTVTASYTNAAGGQVNTNAHIIDKTAVEAGLGGNAKISSFRQTWSISKTMTCGLYHGDTDSDGICNDWENPSVNGNHCLNVMMPSPFPSYVYDGCRGSNPIDALAPTTTQKDVYVWIDSLKGFQPSSNQSFVNVTNVFSSINLGGGAYNPRLHVLVNHNVYPVTMPPPIPPNPLSNVTDPNNLIMPDGFNNIKHVNFVKNNAHVAISQVFHYGLLANKVGTVTQDDGSHVVDSGSSGYGEIWGNDFIITLGSFGVTNGTGGTGYANYPTDWLAGTFMHELGHNLYLTHGGAPSDQMNCKPNYLSVMSYSRQFGSEFPWPSRTVTAYHGYPQTLNYSGEKLDDISEANLPTTIGFANARDRNTVWGPAPGYTMAAIPQSGQYALTWPGTQRNVDTLTTPSTANPANMVACADSTNNDSLAGFKDWTALNLLFRGSSAWDAGFLRSMTPTNTEFNVTGYHAFLKNALTEVKNEVHDKYGNNINSTSKSIISDKIDNAADSINQNNYDKAIDDLNNLNNNCYNLITDPKPRSGLCDDLIPREIHALSLTDPFYNP